LRQRRDASEADLAVLDHQLTTTEEFGHDEVSFVVRWQTGAHRSAQIEALSYLARLVATSY
jgi:hypothetical protein